MVVVVGYCVRYIILLCCLYYFNVLNVKWVIKRDKVVFWVAKSYGPLGT